LGLPVPNEIGTKAFSVRFEAVEIAVGKAIATDVQLAGDPDRSTLLSASRM